MTTSTAVDLSVLLEKTQAERARRVAPLEEREEALAAELEELRRNKADVCAEFDADIEAILRIQRRAGVGVAVRSESDALSKEPEGGSARSHPPLIEIVFEILRDAGVILRHSVVRDRAADRYPTLNRPQSVQEQVSRLAKEGHLILENIDKAKYVGLPEWREGRPHGWPFAIEHIPPSLRKHFPSQVERADLYSHLDPRQLAGNEEAKNLPTATRNHPW